MGDKVLKILGLISLVLWVELSGYEMDSARPVEEFVARLALLFALWGLALSLIHI